MLRSHAFALTGALSGALLAAVSSPAQDCAGTRFWAAVSLEARDSPREAVIGDFNADGLPDLAVAVFQLNAVQVSLRQPSGGYISQSYGTAQGVGFQPDDLAAGDIDGDSDIDLVVVNSFDKTFTVLKNGGTGLFTVSQTVALGFNFGDLALGDLDGDGDLDLVSVGSGTNKEFSVFLNTGGSFAWSRDYTVAGVPRALVLAHLDGDSALDVAVASSDDGSVSILWNTGNGVLSAPVRIATLAGPTALAAGDVNGDGRIDLLTAHSAAGQVGVLDNQGGRNFAPVRAVATAVRTDTLALGDVDQDGDLDLAVTGIEPSQVVEGASILLNSGTGDFVSAQRFDVGKGPLAIALGDLDGDGDADVVVTNQSSNDLRLFTNQGGRVAAGSRTDFGTGSGVEGMTHGDLDGDGRQDLILAQRNQVQVLRHVGGAIFAPPVAYPAGTSVIDVAAGDIDGDGDPDVVVADDNTDDIAVLRNTGGALGAPVRFPACDGPHAVVLADMDGDGDLDAVVACFFGSTVKVMKNNGAGSFPTSVGLGFGPTSSPHALAVGDLDGDGDRDIVVALNNSNLVTVIRNDGAFFNTGWSDSGCNTPESLAVADVNGDGRLDIAASCRLGARVRIYLNAGGGTFTLGETPLVINPLYVALADMDGDGDKDLVVVRGNTRGVAVFANDGAGHFAASRDIAADADAWSMDVVDWDGDGDFDVATGASGLRASTAVLNTRVGCPASAVLGVTGGSVAEGNAGAAPLMFNVTLSTPVSWPVTVNYQTADGTATAGSDYDAVGGTLTFAPGETQKTVVVAVFGDTAVEPDETFFLDLSQAEGVPIGTAQAGGTIVNDDQGSPTALLSLDLTSVENGAGFVRATPATDPCMLQAGTSMHCEYEFSTDTIVALIPEATPGSRFTGWTGACTGTGSCVLPMSEARQVGASFLGPRTLTVQLNSVEGGRGRVNVSPEPLSPGSFCDNFGQPNVYTCTFQYAPDTPVTITNMANPDSKFMTWAGACSGDLPCQVFLSAPGPGPVVEASFLGPRTLTVQLNSVEGGHGRVNVMPDPLTPGSFCDNFGQPDVYTCTFQYRPDTPVTITNMANPDSKFTTWAGACSGDLPCQVFLSAPGPGPVVEASFLGPRTLTVQLNSVEGGHGRVNVMPDPLTPGSFCDNYGQPDVYTCTFQYRPDTPVTITNMANPDSKFTTWAGACSGEGPCQVFLSAPGPGPVVEASFLGPRTLTVQLNSVEGGHGRVNVMPDPLSPGSFCDNLGQPNVYTCTFQYRPDTPVTITNMALPDSKFTTWAGACLGDLPCQVFLSAPGPGPVVEASFLGPRTLTVQLNSVEGGHGRVNVSPEPLSPGSFCDNLGQPDVYTCTFQYRPDTPVTITNMALPDSKFTTWAGACLGDLPCQVFLSAPGPGPVVEASFLGPRTLTVQLNSVEGGRGRVNVSPDPLTPGSFCDNLGQPDVYTCTFQYRPDTPVTITNMANPDSKFTAWAGACLGDGPCQVFLSAPGPGPVVEASFLGPRTLTLSIASSRNGRGSLAVEPAALDGQASCALPPSAPSAVCTLHYAPDTAVTVTPLPEPGSVVRDLVGCPPTGPCTVTMSAAASVSAVFEIPNRAPTANAGGPYAGVRGQAINFNGSGSTDPDGDALSYQWTFGDGAAGTGVSPSHAYASLGTFTVSLVVSDGELSSMPATTSVTISNLPPVVTLTSPADGSVHPASLPIALAADALDADGVVIRVEFYAGAVKVGEALGPPFTASWTGMAPGDYVLTARATDDWGATTTSAPRLVHVNPSPVVALTAPANGAIFVAPASVPLAATASDDGSVVAVEFYQGSTLLGVDTTSPYTFNWSNVPAGRYVLTARARDDVGGTTSSAPVTIDVVTVVAAAVDSYVRDGGSANNNFGTATALEVRVGSSNQNRWTYLRFNIASLTTIRAAKLRLFGNLTSTTGTPVQARVFSSTNLTWGETSITWNNKPAPGTTILASVPLVNNSTTARWYEWDLTAFLQAEKAAGRTAVTLVLRNDVTSPNTTFGSRQASSNRPELRVTP